MWQFLILSVTGHFSVKVDFIRSDEGLALETSAIVSFTAFHYPHQHTVDTPVRFLLVYEIPQLFCKREGNRIVVIELDKISNKSCSSTSLGPLDMKQVPESKRYISRFPQSTRYRVSLCKA